MSVRRVRALAWSKVETTMALSQLLLQRLERLGPLGDEDRAVLRSLPIERSEFPAHHDIARMNDRPGRSVLVASGIAASYKDTLRGQRQIHAFYRAGDLPDVHSLHLTTLDSSLQAISRCEVGLIRHDHLRQICANHPRITAALWRSTLIDASIYKEWMTNVGQRVGTARLAHLFCEEYVRSELAGLSEPGPHHICPLPMTQTVLGEALGLSAVHLNRSLQAIRRSGYITLEQGRLVILDWPALVELAGFDTTYLHLDDDVADRYVRKLSVA